MLNKSVLNYFRHFPSSWPSFFFMSAFIQSLHISTCKNYAYWCKIVTFRALLEVAKAYDSPCYFRESRNEHIIAHFTLPRIAILLRSKFCVIVSFCHICSISLSVFIRGTLILYSFAVKRMLWCDPNTKSLFSPARCLRHPGVHG